MTNFDEELAQLRADVVVPDAEATRRIAARLSQSIGVLATGSAAAAPSALSWARPWQLMASFMVGGIVGAGAYGALRAPRVERVYVERPAAVVQAPVPSVAPASSAAPAPSVAPESAPSSRAATPTPSTSVASDRLASLAEQQALLDVARAAFARGDYAATLKTLTIHAKRFSKSVLAEEREALQIKALAASGRMPEARALAASFRTRHPQSLLSPSIIDSVGTIP